MPASVRERLTQAARQSGEDFQYVATRYALERFLYRISQSEHRGTFILKGALLFQFWTRTPHRTTRDLDLLAKGNPSVKRFEEIFRQICCQAVLDDGLSFVETSIHGEQIKEEDASICIGRSMRAAVRRAARVGNWKGVEQPYDAHLQLFDVQTDIGEEHDLAASHPEVVRQIETIFAGADSHSDIWKFPKKPVTGN